MLANIAVIHAQWTVSGRVTDAKDGSPLIGATVEEIGTSSGTVTDFDGNYSLSISSGKAKIQVKYVGYTAQDIVVGDRSTIDVAMSEDGILLEQVVVVGYGVQRKSDVTGSIASVKGKEIEKIATSNIEQALQGKVAGLHVTPASGNPGAGAVIRIRGTGTLNNANPLYVIDGMITYDASLVNPQDVESEVLKMLLQPIYGSRGANGVIIITTKMDVINKRADFCVNLLWYPANYKRDCFTKRTRICHCLQSVERSVILSRSFNIWGRHQLPERNIQRGPHLQYAVVCEQRK